MKRFASIAVSFAFFTCAFSQESQVNRLGFVRIPVYHGDPWSIKALLEGISISQPELSSILGFAGVPDKDSELVQSIFGGKGSLIVNPTDNSILFIPTKG